MRKKKLKKELKIQDIKVKNLEAKETPARPGAIKGAAFTEANNPESFGIQKSAGNCLDCGGHGEFRKRKIGG